MIPDFAPLYPDYAASSGLRDYAFNIDRGFVMEDMRQLLRDHDAEVAPESLGYLLRGLNTLLHDLLQDSTPSDPAERMRHGEAIQSVAFCARLMSTMLARWLGEHVDTCRESR